MKQVIDLLCLTDFLDHPWLMPLFVIGVKEVFCPSSYHFSLYIVSQSGGILFLFPFTLFKTKEMLFSVSHAVRYVKKDKLFNVLEKPFKNHPRCEKLVIKAWWPKHVVQGKGSKSLTRDFLWFFYEKCGENGYRRTLKLFKSIRETLGTQQWASCITICVGLVDSYRWDKYKISGET